MEDSEEESDVIPYQGSENEQPGAMELQSRAKTKRGKENLHDKRVSSKWKSIEKIRRDRRERSRSPSEADSLILRELKKATDIMSNLSKKMKRHKSRLTAIENKLSEAVSSASSSSAMPKRKSTKKTVPVEVRRETRRVYNLLVDDVEATFDGCKIKPGITFKDPHNQTVFNVLIQEVKGLNPSFLTQHIREAAYRFYRLRTEDQSAKRRGTFQEKGKAKRRHERLVRKFQERKKIFEAGTYKDGEKEAWKSIMTLDFMSSDESYTDDGQEVLVSKPLLWQSERVTHFKKTLDENALKQKSPLARRQMKPRKIGTSSSRPKPSGEFPVWVFDEQYTE